MESTTVLAVDLGAESGRVMAVEAMAGSLRVEELHRFNNRPVEVRGTLHWDILSLWREIEQGIELGMARHPASLGVDTWAVDFGLLDASGELLGNPVHYRDRRTDGALERLTERLGRERIFRETGIQFLPINTLVQLFVLRERRSAMLDAARSFLTIPDLFHFWLTGAKTAEFTNATTTQLFNPHQGTWSETLLGALELDPEMFPAVVAPGTTLGAYRGVKVIAPATHDTGSAVAGMPAETDDVAFISSGTWSLVGTLVDRPVVNAAALAANVTNEGASDGGFRLLKNVMGLWIVQECRRTWAKEWRSMSYDEIVAAAVGEPALRSVIPVDDPRFLAPGDHPAVVQQLCKERGEPVPESPGAIARCVFDSLALAYRRVLDTLTELTGRRFEVVHILGGGSQNRLLCQLTANACRRDVIAGPAEATVMGNAVVQLQALGVLDSAADGRRWIAASTERAHYKPQGADAWDAALERLAAADRERRAT